MCVFSFVWFYSNIHINYHLWKSAQTQIIRILCSLTSWSYIYFSCHIGKCIQTSKQCLNIIKKSYIGSFPDVLAISALITILGNVHRPHQQYPNTINNSFNRVYSLSSDFTAIFISITIFGKVHRPCKKDRKSVV